MVGEKGKFTGEIAGICKFIENHPKVSNYRSLSTVWNIEGKWHNVIPYFVISISFNNFEDTFAVLLIAFSMLNSQLYPRNSGL